MFSQPLEVLNLKDNVQNQKAITNIVVGAGDYKSIKADINPNIIDRDFKGQLKLYIDSGHNLDSLVLKRTEGDLYKLDYKLPEDAVQVEVKFNTNSKNRFRKDTQNVYQETLIIDKAHVDLQFFPEGGKLVNGLLSTIGFKALDYNGLGYKVEGVVRDHKDEEVTSFKSNDLGMGTFKLNPQKGSYYYAEIKNNETTYKYDLPNTYFKGSVIAVVDLQDDLRLSVSSKNEPSKYLTVDVSSRGVKYQRFRFDQKGSISTAIPKKSLPDGIIKITVRDDKNQILCERLVFNQRLDQRINIQLNANSANYSQREKVQLQLKLDSITQNNNVSLSALVLDKSRHKTSKSYKPSLLSYMLLNSELSGFIEQPDYYFNTTTKNNKLDLDALMLTQGWRNYNYQKEKPLTIFEYRPQTNLEISGSIGEYFNPKKRPKEPLNLNLMIQDDIPHVYSSEIPENGAYHFKLYDVFKSNPEFFMQVVDKKGKPVDFTINLNQLWKPNIKSEKQVNYTLPNEQKKNFKAQMEVVNKVQKAYETTFNTIALDEVTVKSYKMTPAREAFIAKHGEPTKVLEGKDLVDQAPDWNYGVLSVIRYRFPNEVIIKEVGPPSNRFLIPVVRGTKYPAGFTYVLVDNKPVSIREYQFIQNIPVEEVESIDILESPRLKNKYCSEVLRQAQCPKYIALINIYTKSGKGINGLVKPKGFKLGEIQGFTESVKFYSPKYETLSNQDWVTPDNRSVIYWEPNFRLNAQGEYVLEFYNDDHIGEVSVIIEAISKDGKIGYVEKTYSVKEAER